MLIYSLLACCADGGSGLRRSTLTGGMGFVRFMKEDLLAQILHALLALRGLVVQKTKLTSDCGRLLRELLDSLLQESYENKRHFVRACTSGLQSNCQQEKKDRTSLVSCKLQSKLLRKSFASACFISELIARCFGRVVCRRSRCRPSPCC